MITLSDLGAAVLLLGMIMYAVFGGADFGGGIWTAFASGPRKKEQRESLFHAIGPVWETNHVWLIFVVVVLFMVFPKGFAYLFIALLAPLVIALVGINFRGAAFAFRHFGRQTGREVPPIARTFSVASLLTPFALGMTVTAAASEQIRIVGGEVVGALGLDHAVHPGGRACGDGGLRPPGADLHDGQNRRGSAERFSQTGDGRRLDFGCPDAPGDPGSLHQRPPFRRQALPAALARLRHPRRRRRPRHPSAAPETEASSAQITAAGTVALVLLGFGATMYPDLILGELSIAAASAPRATLLVFFAVLPFGVALLAPSLFFLYWTFRGPPNPKTPPA
jgi:cytochrome d ubiquinol oxidase subunit II